MKTFISPSTEGRNDGVAYIVTILLVISGIIGLGRIPLIFVLSAKGYSPGEIEHITVGNFQEILGNNLFFTLSLFPFLIGFGMMLVAFRFMHRRPVISFFTTRPVFDFKRFLAGFSVWGGMLAILFLIGYLQGHESLVWNFDSEKFFPLLLICIFIVPLQTGFEELFFRGYLLQLLGRATSRGLVIAIVNGLLFGSLHGLNPEIDALGWFALVFYVVSGIFAALLTIMDDGIELSWGFHTANNFMGILIITNGWQAFQTDALFVDTSKPVIGWDMYMTLFICYPLLLFIFSRMYKWSNWKQRLF